jgi:hypothetical protein
MTYHRLRGRIIIFAAVLVSALFALPDEQFFAADARVAATETVSSDANNL